MENDNLFDERKHLEFLLQQRFNFFIVMFGFGLAAPGNITSDIGRGVCSLGVAFVCVLMSIPLWRAGRLAETAVDLICEVHEGCALERVRNAAKISPNGPRAATIMIYWVPTCCCTFLFIRAFMSFSILK